MWDAEPELRAIWQAALAAADPGRAVGPHLPARPKGRLAIVAAGKGAAPMARAAEAHYGAPLEGVVVVPFTYDQPAERLRTVIGGHPVPNAAGEAAAAHILALAQELGKDDLLLVLLSGGASALLPLPAEGVTLADKQAVTRALLASGAPIAAINCVRKHLSRLKGGRLAAAAYPARTVTLAVSDVPGDKRGVIGSGPTVPDRTALSEARAVLARYRVDAPASVIAALENPLGESIKPWDARIRRSRFRLVLRPADVLRAAARTARELGYKPVNLGIAEGEAADVAGRHAFLAARAAAERRKAAFISGGELTVTGATGEAGGGRCREYALALALSLGQAGHIAALAADTDGIDGTKDAAGALVLPGDLERARAAGRDPEALLLQHRSGDYFAALGRALVTGPTFTNAGDFRVILVTASQSAVGSRQ